jgi:DHA2 family multidrug resistance protein
MIPFVPLLMKRFDSRWLVSVGLVVLAASCFMNLHLDSDYAAPQLLVPDITRALGQALVMTPLSAIAGLFNMLRNLGGAIGTAAVETFYTKREQYHSFIINAHVSPLQPATQEQLAGQPHIF